ncbi:ABC transporter permease [Gallibacterium salpingitidis]|uniref:Membrane protein n=1 Tax=Gallibacterium salpingitidis TaxID=505341 RepID=A0A1A7NZ24_9PAST|nr:ABC transporter permease [Gallibacterium salpingitidis]OBW94953.1 membrane protein [Gallibacterium salpingitidis]
MTRLFALVRKEMLQIIRDPSSILIAFVLPFILLFIFGYGINLDSNKMNIGLVSHSSTPLANSLTEAFTHSKFLEVKTANDRRELYGDLTTGKIKGIVVIPEPFTLDLLRQQTAKIQVLTDGSQPNTAMFVNGYTSGVVQTWLMQQSAMETQGIQLKERYLFNPELKSRHFLLPGSMAITMTLIGTLLTALVIAREWERGTMEAMMATPVTITQILLGKLIPYYILGIGSMLICFLVTTLYYQVPFHGSFLTLFLATSVFLICALGQGLLISSLAKDQFVASQIAIMFAFLPAFMLSGFVFEISSMPLPVQWLTYLFSVRYYVTSLQTLFLAGNVWSLLAQGIAIMLIIGILTFLFTKRKTQKRIDL